MTLQSDTDQVIASIRTNIVFEKMIVSVLIVSALSGFLHFLIGATARAVGGLFSLAGAGIALYNAVVFMMLFFIGGFAVSLAIGIPLFRALEYSKFRRAWPYCVVAVAVSFIILVALGMTPSVEAPMNALFLMPGLAAAMLFTRKMRPFWVAAARADEAARSVIRLN